MASRNTVRTDLAESYYHVYTRGVNKSTIFRDDQDKEYVLYLISRHLSKNPTKTKVGYPYPHYREGVELLAYCIMDNHLHLLLYQNEQGYVSQLMRSVLTAYVAHYNKKSKRTGPLFESRYKASLIDNDAYLLHISRYIHLNPRDWKHYQYSSVGSYGSAPCPEWLQTDKILELHRDKEEYMSFLEEYEERRDELATVKRELKKQLVA